MLWKRFDSVSAQIRAQTHVYERWSLVKARLYAISEAFKASEAMAGYFKESGKSLCYTFLKLSLIPMCSWCILIQNSSQIIPVRLLKRLTLFLLLSTPHSCPSSRWKCKTIMHGSIWPVIIPLGNPRNKSSSSGSGCCKHNWGLRTTSGWKNRRYYYKNCIDNFTTTLGFFLCNKNERQHTKRWTMRFSLLWLIYFTINIFYGQRLKFCNFYT